MTRDDIIRMAREAGLEGYRTPLAGIERFFAAAYAAGVGAENARLRSLLMEYMSDPEWRDKIIYPVYGKSHQNWLLKIKLPVPLSEPDKSFEAALERAIRARGGKK